MSSNFFELKDLTTPIVAVWCEIMTKLPNIKTFLILRREVHRSFLRRPKEQWVSIGTWTVKEPSTTDCDAIRRHLVHDGYNAEDIRVEIS